MRDVNEPYYGRSTDGHEPFQLLREHLTETSELMEEFCSKFTCPEIGKVCGLLHDIGKYSDEFQRRVRGEPIQVHHSTAGAKIASSIAETENGRSQIAYYLMSYVIAGHHSGLPDSAELYPRLQNCNPELFSPWKTEISLPSLHLDLFQDGYHYSKKEVGFSLFLYTHFLFSCLVDADRTSARCFSGTLPVQQYPSLSTLKDMLDTHMEAAFSASTGDMNKLRSSILHDCRQESRKKRGMFTLTVPTGGGKTLSSLSFALNHAVTNTMDRIIYAIPFTSIIEQNAAVYKKIFGEDNVIEHHSNFIIPSTCPCNHDDPENENQKLALSVANWNAPLILTTNVQFFESLFSAHPSRSRKVHNIENSVIILDEVQALPNELLRPCMYALAELVKNYHCSVVLCTATQPEFKENGILPDLPVTPIVPNYQELFEKMKRVSGTFLGTQSLDEISSALILEQQCLCIVNTKRYARDLYNRIKSKGDCFHLSTNMYPAHRKKVIAEIRTCLRNELPCRVVSTQLIEAGVDIDFPVVYRSLAGVDALQQAAGRCNREGNLRMGKFYVFKPAEPKYAGPDYLKQTAGIAESLSDADYLSLDTVKRYFRELFSVRSQKMDKTDILSLCTAAVTIPPRYPFRSISENFKMISDEGYAIVIPIAPECKKLLASVSENNVGYIQVQISQYCVNVRKKDMDKLYAQGNVGIESDVFVVLLNLSCYDESTGFVSDCMEQDYIL